MPDAPYPITTAAGLPVPAPAVTCARCDAACCRLEVMLMAGDDVSAHLTRRDRWGREVMARHDDGWCAAVDRATFRCRIYATRPRLCREFETGGEDCRQQRAEAGGIDVGPGPDPR